MVEEMMNRDEFHILYTRFALDIFRFVLFLSGNRSLAEDITSETFVRAFSAMAPVIEGTAKGYLLTIARNLYLEHLRRSSRTQPLSQDINDAGASIEHNIENKMEFEALMKYLQKFPETDRSAVMLRAEGLSYQEIAHYLNISIAAAKVKVHRMRLHLAHWKNQQEKIAGE
ncbi:MAG: hypothetical protein Kow00108_25730 [Calditrichia bacterium]